jgi:hypothetical protein
MSLSRVYERGGACCFLLVLSGVFLDCLLAVRLLSLVHMLVDMVDLPVLKLVLSPVLKLVLSPTLPILNEYPQIADLSIMIAWGMHLSKTALASIVAGHAVAFLAHHGVAKP